MGSPGAAIGGYRYLLDLLARVQGEGLLGQADIKVGVPQTGLPRSIKHHDPRRVPDHRVEHHAVVPGGHHHHAPRGEHHPAGGPPLLPSAL